MPFSVKNQACTRNKKEQLFFFITFSITKQNFRFKIQIVFWPNYEKIKSLSFNACSSTELSYIRRLKNTHTVHVSTCYTQTLTNIPKNIFLMRDI